MYFSISVIPFNIWNWKGESNNCVVCIYFFSSVHVNCLPSSDSVHISDAPCFLVCLWILCSFPAFSFFLLPGKKWRVFVTHLRYSPKKKMMELFMRKESEIKKDSKKVKNFLNIIYSIFATFVTHIPHFRSGSVLDSWFSSLFEVYYVP